MGRIWDLGLERGERPVWSAVNARFGEFRCAVAPYDTLRQGYRCRMI